jgi:hypothetical protein
MPAWGSIASSPSHFADHLPSSLPPTAVRKLDCARQLIEPKAAHQRKRLETAKKGRPEKVSDGFFATRDAANRGDEQLKRSTKLITDDDSSVMRGRRS